MQRDEPTPAARRRLRRGLTIVELIVVIGIIALLMAMALPSLRGARNAGRLSSEQSAARQLMLGYLAYANSNQDRVLTGYAPASFQAFDAGGKPIGGTTQLNTAKRRYPWRLAPYLDYVMESFFVNEHREVLERIKNTSHADYLYAVSIAPSLGLNTEWIGGDSSPGSLGFLPPTDPVAKALDYSRFYITRITQAIHPERLIVFASARGVDPEVTSPLGNMPPVEGHYRVISPYLAEFQPERWDEAFHPNQPPEKFGYVSPRHNRRAVVAFLGGNVGALSTDELHDMRHWANWADKEDWKLPLLNQ